jgi:hypothetical protein
VPLGPSRMKPFVRTTREGILVRVSSMGLRFVGLPFLGAQKPGPGIIGRSRLGQE